MDETKSAAVPSPVVPVDLIRGLGFDWPIRDLPSEFLVTWGRCVDLKASVEAVAAAVQKRRGTISSGRLWMKLNADEFSLSDYSEMHDEYRGDQEKVADLANAAKRLLELWEFFVPYGKAFGNPINVTGAVPPVRATVEEIRAAGLEWPPPSVPPELPVFGEDGLDLVEAANVLIAAVLRKREKIDKARDFMRANGAALGSAEREKMRELCDTSMKWAKFVGELARALLSLSVVIPHRRRAAVGAGK